MNLEKVIHNVLSKVIQEKYPRIKDIDVIQFGEEYYRIVYYMNRRISDKLEDEITTETMNLFKMMGIDDNDFAIEFL